MIISIRKNSIPYFLMIIPFSPIEYISNVFPIWSTICSYARILILAYLLYRLITIWKQISVPLILALIYFATALLSTLLRGAGLYTIIYYGIFLFGMILLVEDGIFYDPDSMLEGILFWFEILVYANLLYYIIDPSGYSVDNENYHLLGNYNTVVRKLFPGLVLGGVQAFRTKGRITLRFACMYLALGIYLVAVGALTACFGMAFLALGILYYSIRKKSGIFRVEIFAIISAGLSILFAVLSQFSFFQWFIVGALGREMTLSNRVYIWERALKAIQAHPIFGYGQLSHSETSNIISGSVDPHNILLGILFYGGIIGLIVLVIIVIVVGRKLSNSRQYDSAIVAVFESGCCAYFLMWIFEPFACINEFYKIFFFFTLAYHCLAFSKSKISIKNEAIKFQSKNNALV